MMIPPQHLTDPTWAVVIGIVIGVGVALVILRRWRGL